MAKVKVEVEVSEKTLALGKGLGQVVLDVKKSLDDGFDFAQDVGPIVSSIMMNLLPVIQNVKEIPVEFEEDKVAAILALEVGLKPMVDGLIKKA